MSHAKILIACGIILAASVGFFAGSFAFKDPFHFRGPKPDAMQQMDPDAQWNGHHKEMRGMLSKEQLDSTLGLSKEQIAQMNAHRTAADSAIKALRKQIRAAEIKLHDILGADNISETDLQAVRTELISLNQQRLDQRIADIRFFRSVLNADQKKKMDEIHKQFLAQMKADKLQKRNSEMAPDEDDSDEQPGGVPGQGPHGNHGHHGGPDGNGPQNGQRPPRD